MTPSTNHKHLEISLLYSSKANLNWRSTYTQITEENKLHRRPHYDTLKWTINTTKEYWTNQSIETHIPLLLKIDAESYNIDFLRATFDFEIVLEEQDWYIIAVAPDLDFTKFERALEKFINNAHGWNNVALLHCIESEDDRLKTIMWEELYWKYQTISDTEEIILDVSVSCEWKRSQPERWKRDTDETFNQKKMQWQMEIDNIMIEREDQIKDFLETYSWLELGNYYTSEEFWNFTIRMKINWQWFKDLGVNA